MGVIEYMEAGGTGPNTFSASHASAFKQGDFWFCFKAFGIVAPYTPQGTTFEKEHRAVTRFVVYGKPLYLKNITCDHS